MVRVALLFTLFSLLCSASVFASPPPKPDLSYALNGTRITIDWSSGPTATGYIFAATPYPYTSDNEVHILDLGQTTTIAANLPEGFAMLIAVMSYNNEGNSPISDVEHFIVQDHQLDWGPAPELGLPRTRMGGAVLNDKIYTFGGFSGDGSLLNTIETFDTTTDEWSQGTMNSQALADLSGAAFNGEIYFFGATDGECGTTSFAERYTPSTETWSPLSGKPTAASGSPAVVYNDKIYLFGGWQENTCTDSLESKILLDEVEAYTPASDSWENVTIMPKALEGAAVAVVRDKAYVMGGVDVEGNGQTTIMAYDFISKTWQTEGLGNLTVPRVFPTSSASPVIDDIILLAGGWLHESQKELIENLRKAFEAEGYTETDSVELYSPRARSVAIGEPLPAATAGHIPATIGEDLFVVGGTTQSRATDKTWRTGVVVARETSASYLNVDSDSDGFSPMQGDCVDNNPFINPDAKETCGDGVDQNCDNIDEPCPVETESELIGIWRSMTVDGLTDETRIFNIASESSATSNCGLSATTHEISIIGDELISTGAGSADPDCNITMTCSFTVIDTVLSMSCENPEGTEESTWQAQDWTEVTDSYLSPDNERLEFILPNIYNLYVNDIFQVTGEYYQVNGQFEIIDHTQGSCSEPGLYSIEFADNTMSFSAIADSCTVRNNRLHGVVWTKAP